MASNVTDTHWRLARRYGRRPFQSPVNETLAELLSVVFSKEEAGLAAVFPAFPAGAGTIAKRGGMSVEQAESLLSAMDRKGAILSYESKGTRKYTLLPIIPGLFEFTMMSGKRDADHKKFARLFTAYYNREYLEPAAGRMKGVVKIIPVEAHVTSQIGVLHTDRVSELIDSHDRFAIALTCSCRHTKELIGHGCGLPKDVCMVFGVLADYAVDRGLARRADKQEMVDAAKRAEEAGLVHLGDNVAQANFLCSCCACCCDGLRIITEFNFPAMIANSHFMAHVDSAACKACGKCTRRCPTGALTLYNKQLLFREWRCIGCGVCVSQCTKNHALSMVEKANYAPPHESTAHLAADIGLQSIGLKKLLDDRYPGVYQRLKSTLGNKIRSSD